MAELEAKKVEPEATHSVPPPPAFAPAPEATIEEKPVFVPPPPLAEEKPVFVPPPPLAEEKHDDSKALVAVEETPEVVDAKAVEEKPKGSINRDAVLSRLTTEKRESLIKAWEVSEGSKAENKAEKKLAAIAAWENSKKAAIEAELRQMEEKLEKQKAGQVEKLKNKIALLHKAAEDKRAAIEATLGEEILKAEETAAKYHATGTGPKKILGCF